MATKKESFEKIVEDIYKILDVLSKDDILLSDAVGEYKKGIKLIESADKMLQEAKIIYEELNAKNN